MHPFRKKIQEVLQEIEFYTKKIDDSSRTAEWDVEYLTDFKKLRKKIIDIVEELKRINRKFETNQTDDILNIAKTLQNKFTRLANKHREIKEQSSTSQGGASFSPGTGAQYATPKAFNKKTNSKGAKDIYYYKMGYKTVPKKIKGSGLEVKKLYENEAKDFQQERIDVFTQIEKELNDLPPLISNAKNATIEYYNNNPGSYAIVRSTDLILEYIKDIKQLLKGEEE